MKTPDVIGSNIAEEASSEIYNPSPDFVARRLAALGITAAELDEEFFGMP